MEEWPSDDRIWGQVQIKGLQQGPDGVATVAPEAWRWRTLYRALLDGGALRDGRGCGGEGGVGLT